MTPLLVDTSFLITLADPARKHHDVAKTYFKEALRRNAPMYLSSIVASEFQVKQAVTDLPLRHFEVLPFNIDHAMTAGLLLRELRRDAGDDRVAVKDDVKLIAQAICGSITHVLTEDANTLAKYIKRCRELGQATLHVILLADGFDATWFTDGQKSIPEV